MKEEINLNLFSLPFILGEKINLNIFLPDHYINVIENKSKFIFSPQ